MTVTGKSFDKGPNFCFKDLLDLNLHHYADDVSEIVDQSSKESKIENLQKACDAFVNASEILNHNKIQRVPARHKTPRNKD